MPASPSHPRAAELVATLGLQPHPEGGWYRELFRSPREVQPVDGRGTRAALTTIDFLLCAGEHSAWHRVASDEAWHLLEGGPLRLWLLAPTLDSLQSVDLAGPEAGLARTVRRHVVPAHWWQAAVPLGEYVHVGATVGPGFDFADFAFGREQATFAATVRQRWPELAPLLG